MSGVSVTLPLDLIEVRERSRIELRHIDVLATSIRARGLLHPPVVRRDGETWVLVAGLRRLEALRQLGCSKTPVTVAVALTDEQAALHAEGEENTCREPFTPSEAVRHAERIVQVERRLAKERQLATLKQGDKQPEPRSADSAERDESPSARQSRARTAEAVGMSHDTLRKAAAVVQAAEAEPERYTPLVEQMDRTGKVDPAWKALNQQQIDQAADQLDDGSIAQQRLLAAFWNGSRAFTRGLLPLDPQAVADALDSEGDRHGAQVLISDARDWLTRFERALSGLKLVQGGKS
jgi:ParB-like chromosome segregation protein Spo0J